MTCQDCRHFFITHEARYPYSCRAMRFKSARMPGEDVREASGQPCLHFQPRLSRRAARADRA
ncbi:MAG: hypothetical protein LBG69_04415 [Zoogloeaceae bacterium]|jgi:hypothetical protein|nr:hypothetical protein [Zoogloeaceae bacterium]